MCRGARSWESCLGGAVVGDGAVEGGGHLLDGVEDEVLGLHELLGRGLGLADGVVIEVEGDEALVFERDAPDLVGVEGVAAELDGGVVGLLARLPVVDGDGLVGGGGGEVEFDVDGDVADGELVEFLDGAPLGAERAASSAKRGEAMKFSMQR